MTVALVVDGRAVDVDDRGSLLDALRDQLGLRSAKDGCSPQGQCGCCTVLVDGKPRVACVTPVRRVAGRTVTTVDGLEDRRQWADAFTAHGASQCGFCTPGIIVRLVGPDRSQPGQRRGGPARPPVPVHRLADHRRAATTLVPPHRSRPGPCRPPGHPRGPSRRSSVGPGGRPRAWRLRRRHRPSDALVAVPDGQGRMGRRRHPRRGTRSGREGPGPPQHRPAHPLDVPAGEWDVTLRTTWVEPAYLEPDASWCEPGGEPATPLANGGAFGAKRESPSPRPPAAWPTTRSAGPRRARP